MKLKLALHVLAVSLISSFIACSGSQSPDPEDTLSTDPGLHEEITIIIDGIVRTYDYYVPRDLGADLRPLVFLLHGGGGSKDNLTGESGLKAPFKVWMDLAETDSFLLVYPQATEGSQGKRNWNDCRLDATNNPDVDDVGFIDRLIDLFSAELNIDTNRIYVSGISNGGLMSLRLALELSDRIAAVGSVVASMHASDCATPVNPISVLFMNGTDDPLMPYDGGEIAPNAGGRGTVRSTYASVQYWVDFNQTDTVAVEINFTDIDTGDSSTAKRYTYSQGTEGTQVNLYEITGGGHVEPSIQEQYARVLELVLGKQNHDIEMAEEIWRFFKDKQL